MKKLRIAFCGTPEFAIPTLEILARHPLLQLELVISQPSRPAGRGHQLTIPPVILFGEKTKIRTWQTENINQDLSLLVLLEQLKLDVLIVLAFSQFLGKKILELPKLGCFNIHTSLLPKYRGASPIQHAIINGEQFTGVCIQKMVTKMDAGDIAHIQIISISEIETATQLSTRLKYAAALATNDFIENLILGKINYIPQNENEVSYAPVLTKEDGLIYFNKYSVVGLLNKIRGLDPWPGTYCYCNNRRMKIISAMREENPLILSPGQVQTNNGKLLIGCLDGVVRLTHIQIEGKNITTDSELLRGQRDKIEIQFE